MSLLVLSSFRFRTFFSLLFLLLWTGNAAHAQGIALVQHAGKDGGTTTTTSLAFVSPNTAGNWIAVCVRGGFSSSQAFAISDSNGNFYRRAAQIGFTGSAVTLAVFYAENISGGANIVTVADTVSGPLRIAILEYSGVATSNSLDAVVAGTGNGTFASTPSLTTTADGDLLLASIATTNPRLITAGSSYSISDFVPAEPNTKLIAEQGIQSTSGPASASASLSSSDSWGAVLAPVKPASAGTGSAPPSITGLSPTSGPAGTSVTITGTNFGSSQDTSTVTFSGTDASPTSWSDTTIVAAVPSGATSGNVVVTVGGVASNGMSFTVTITAVAPSISAQPANQTVTAGQTATFAVSAAGTAPLSYQWQRNGANISGATSSTYTTPATTTSDSGSAFNVIVSNSAGSVTSNAATLTVNSSAVAPTISTQPTNQTATAGQTATFSVSANGTAPLSYQWQKNGANLSGATSSSYTTPAATTSDNGSAFSVVVSNSTGSVTSNAATLTVNSSTVAPTITSQPSDQTVAAGQAATFRVSASGTAPLSYQWRKGGADIAGATTSTYTTPATSMSDSGSTFDVVVSNSAGSATSSAATLTVNSTPPPPGILGWTFVQNSIATYCVAPASSCNISFSGNAIPTAPTTDVWIVTSNVAYSGGTPVSIANVTGGGGTWIHCPNCSFGSTATGHAVDAWYNLTGNPNNTATISVSLSGSSGNILDIDFIELLPPPGYSAAFDTSGTNVATSCSTCTGVALTISATDAIYQQMNGANPSGWNAWSAPYITNYAGNGIYLDATTGAQTAPTVRLSNSGNAMFMALAFKSTAGTFTPPATQFSVVNYANSGANGLSCNPSCLLTIPFTGSGHLLYLEAANLGSHISSVTGGGTWVVPGGANTCQISATIAGNDNLSCAYVLSSTSGATSLNVTMSGSNNTFFQFWEIASSNGTFSLDTQGSTHNAASFSPSAQALTLTGANDVIFQSIFVPGGTSSVTYLPMPRVGISGAGGQFWGGQAASGLMLNSGSTPPTPRWANQQNNQTIVSAVAFKAQ